MLYTREQVEEAAGMAAGMAAATFMAMPGCGHIVMPSQELSDGIDRVLAELDAKRPERVWADLAEYGWAIICNAQGGDWESASAEWREAAERFRDQYHAALDAFGVVDVEVVEEGSDG